MKLLFFFTAICCSLCAVSQTYTLKDFTKSLKTLGTHKTVLEQPTILIGSYSEAVADGPYVKIALEGELWADGIQFGNLYQVISFDARDISKKPLVVAVKDSLGALNRWDLIIKTKSNKKLIHFRNEQTSEGSIIIQEHRDVDTINLMFVSKDAAEKLKKIAGVVFR
jgi:hypothetical protein